eukprot:TRINITY_DN11966_c0_g2_i2.p2 TRINITY_DN11966_c0_g2~~TRINITY_DN11966_c0_g2_i2.p2  ORF type:complete len:142 (+),score=40.25 TRINITY_DN11966_c0_g2_i2:102-527(+)
MEKVETSVMMSNGKLLKLNLSGNQKISDMKEMIKAQTGMSTQGMSLELSSKVLDDNKTIKDYDIAKESVIYASVYTDSLLVLTVKTPGYQCSVGVDKDSTAFDLKKEVYARLGIRTELQNLLHGPNAVSYTHLTLPTNREV